MWRLKRAQGNSMVVYGFVANAGNEKNQELLRQRAREAFELCLPLAHSVDL